MGKKFVILLLLFFAIKLHAQDSTKNSGFKDALKKTGKAIGKGAKAAGNKTAELASKGHAAVVDKVVEDKLGPDGQKIYVNKDDEYYWIDKKGHKQFVTEEDLVEKEEKEND